MFWMSDVSINRADLVRKTTAFFRIAIRIAILLHVISARAHPILIVHQVLSYTRVHLSVTQDFLCGLPDKAPDCIEEVRYFRTGIQPKISFRFLAVFDDGELAGAWNRFQESQK